MSRSSQPGLPPVAITANRSPLYCDSVDWDRTRRSHMNVVTRTQFPLLTKRSLPKCTGALPYPLPGFKILNRSHCPVVFDSSKLAARVLARTTDPVPLRRNPTAERAPRLTARPTTRPLRRLNPVALARLRHKANPTPTRARKRIATLGSFALIARVTRSFPSTPRARARLGTRRG